MNLTTRILLLGGIVFALALGIFLWVSYLLEKRRALLQRRLQIPSGGLGPDNVLDIAASTTPQGWSGQMDTAFERMIQFSGLGVEPTQALAFIALAAVGLAALLFVWRGELWLSVLGLLVGGGGVFTVFAIMRKRYRRQLSEQMPDALYLLARSLRAGLSMEQAISMAGEQGGKPLADEFRRCTAQLQLGLPVPTALASIGKRVQLLDFDVFVSTVSLHYSMGGNLTVLLDRLAASVRDRNLFRGHFRTATALSRVTAIFIGIMSPLLLLYYALYPPEHVRAFFESPSGWTAVSVAGSLQIIGILWLYRLMQVDY
ncbi:MAG TPA: type II secretion system F family protein [Gemmataceae bacterium]